MIARFRRRFIAVCMLSVTAVLLAILAAINVVSYHAQVARTDRMLDFLVENGGTFPSVPHEAQDAPDAAEVGVDPPNARSPENMNPETRFITRFFAVTFSADGSVASANVDSIASVDSAEAELIARAAVDSGSASGWHGTYRYKIEGTLAVFIDASNVVGSIRQLLMGSCTITASALVVIFLLMMVFSRIATRPVAESLKKQRQFITDASHELKTPLTIISANSEILEMNFGENEWLKSITRQTERMTKLIKSLIELARIDEGAKKRASVRFGLSDAVYDTAMTFSMPAERKGLSLSVNAAPGVLARGDEASVRQLVSILMDNAVKYCDAGGDIEVTLCQTGKYAELSVSNAFECARDLKLDRLFDRFYRADEARTGGVSYGLGLSIAKSIVDAQNGQIRAYADDGRFRIAVRLRIKSYINKEN